MHAGRVVWMWFVREAGLTHSEVGIDPKIPRVPSVEVEERLLARRSELLAVSADLIDEANSRFQYLEEKARHVVQGLSIVGGGVGALVAYKPELAAFLLTATSIADELVRWLVASAGLCLAGAYVEALRVWRPRETLGPAAALLLFRESARKDDLTYFAERLLIDYRVFQSVAAAVEAKARSMTALVDLLISGVVFLVNAAVLLVFWR